MHSYTKILLLALLSSTTHILPLWAETKTQAFNVEEAKSALNKGHPQLSVEILKSLEKERPQSEEVLYYLGKAYFALGETKKAASYFEKVLHINKEHLLALEDLNHVYENLGLFEDARRIYLQRLTLQGQNVDLWIKYSRFLKKHKHYKASEEAIWKALSLVPQNLKLNQEYGHLLETMNVGQDVVAKQWSVCLEIDPDDSLSRYHLAQAQENTGKYTEAKKNYLALVKQHPTYPEPFLRLAILYGEDKFFPEAHYYIDLFISLSPKSAQGLEFKAKFFVEQKKDREAQEIFEKWTVTFPYDESSYLEWGKFLKKNNDHKRGLNIYLQGLSKLPQSLSLLRLVAEEYFNQKDWALAKMYYKRILQHDPHNERALARLAHAAIESQESDEARGYLTLLRKILEDRHAIDSAQPMRMPAHSGDDS